MKIKNDIDLAAHTTIGIGGVGAQLLEIETERDIEIFKEEAENSRFICLGCGSNIVFGDNKLQVPLVKLSGDFEKIDVQENTVEAGAAVRLPVLACHVASAGLAGLEWAGGIPGSVGGALVMNAGSFGGEMADLIKGVKILNSRFEIEYRTIDELEFGYRSSSFSENEIILSAIFELKSGDPEKIKNNQQNILNKRKEMQPLEFPSAGSVFKNFTDVSAGKLIDEAGLKGEKIGGVEVSEKHANFFINRGGARCADVLRLIDRVRRRIYKLFDRKLALEITVINFN